MRAHAQHALGRRLTTLVVVTTLLLGVGGYLMAPPAAAATATPPGASQPFAVCQPTTPSGPPAGTPSGGFHAMTPVRLLDTRLTLGAVQPGCTAVVDLAGVAPVGATGVALEMVGVDANAGGFVTAYPCGSSLPLASNLTLRVGQAVPNTVVLPVDSTRRACFYTNVSTQLVVDISGWFGPGGSSFHGNTPERALDTRIGPRPHGGSGPLVGGTELRVPIAGRGSVPANATAAVVNLTVTNTQSYGYLTAYPCGTDRPLTSTGNYEARDTRALQVMVGLGAGDLCIYSPTTVDLVIDVAGSFAGTDGTRAVALTATRVLDSRDGTGGWSAPIEPGTTMSFDPSMAGTLPVGKAAVLDVVTTRAASSDGWVTLYPCGAALPPTSSVNPAVGVESTNVAVVEPGANGLVCVTSTVRVDLVIDLNASFGPAGGLRDLQVTGGGSLSPAFSADGHDYGVKCQAGSNTLTISPSAVPGATTTISGANGSGVVTVAENDLVTITVTRADASTDTYYLRCLPHDFPDLQVQRPDDPNPGWYMTTTGVSGPPGTTYAVILNDHGAPVWYKKTATPAIDMKLLPNGNLAWTPLLGASFGTNPTGAYEEHSLDGSLVRTWSTVGSPTDHHELLPLPNGNKLMVSYPVRTGVDITALGAGYGSSEQVVDGLIQEIRPDGTVAWEWKSQDHIAPAETTAHIDGLYIGAETPQGHVTDLLHINSVDVDPANGNLVVSARHLDAVFEIRRDPGQADDGTILWKVGGNAPTSPATKDITIVGDPLGGPRRQHDARLSADGHLTMYDNESSTANPARGLDYRLDVAAGTATLNWEYRRPDGAASFGLGSTRRLADGSTIICWGGLQPLLTELGPLGNTTIQVSQVPTGISYRSLKEPLATFDAATLRADAGH